MPAPPARAVVGRMNMGFKIPDRAHLHRFRLMSNPLCLHVPYIAA